MEQNGGTAGVAEIDAPFEGQPAAVADQVKRISKEDAIELIRSGNAKEWNRLRSEEALPSDYSWERFDGLPLDGFNFSGLKFTHASFSNSRLTEAQFRDAILIHATLDGAIAPGASFAGAHLRYASFRGTRLQGASFRGAEDMFLDPLGDREQEPSGRPRARVDFSNAVLTKADFTGARLRKGVFRNVVGDQSIWRSADLSRANFGGARLQGARFNRADWTHEPTLLTEAALRSSQLQGASLADAELGRADLSGSRLTWSRLWPFGNTDLSRADLSDAEALDVRYNRRKLVCLGIRADTCRGNALFRTHVREEDFLRSFRRADRLRYLAYLFWYVAGDCGRSTLRPALWGLLVALAFGVMFNEARLELGLDKHELQNVWADQSGPEGHQDRSPIDIACGCARNFWGVFPLCWHALKHPLKTAEQLSELGDIWNLQTLSPPDAWTPLTGPYLSIVVFTTLGFGDITPSRPAGQVVVAIEVMLGYVVLGVIAASIASRMAKPA